MPVRHNEENLNLALANICPYPVDRSKVDTAKVKTLLLFQAYFSGLPLPIRDYITDTKLVLDSAVRFLQAMIDLSAERGFFDTLLNLMHLCQMLTQGCWVNSSSLINVPFFTPEIILKLKEKEKVEHLCQLIQIYNKNKLKELVKSVNPRTNANEYEAIEDCIKHIPDVSFRAKVFDFDSENLQPILRKGAKIKGKDEIFAVIDIRRFNSQYPMKVHMKKLTKVKDFSWWIVVGNFEENKVYSLKKTFFNKSLHREFQVSMSNSKSRKVDFLLMSDSFIGIDQYMQIDLDSYVTQEPPRPKTVKPSENQLDDKPKQ